MASITRDKRSSAWLVRWRDAAKRPRTKSFRRKADATRFAAQIEQERRTGGAANPNLGKVTVAQVVDDWRVQAIDLKRSTSCRYEGIIRNHILPTFGTMAIADLKRPLIAAWLGNMAATHSKSSMMQALGLLSRICDVAIADERIAKNPCKDVRTPKARRKPVKPVPWDQVEALVAHGGHIADDIHFLATTGLRIGEFIALQVGDVDLGRRRIRVQRSTSQVGGQMVETDTKTGKTRIVAIPDFVWPAVLRRLANRQPGDPLFTSPQGHRVRYRNWYRTWKSACRAAGITAHPHMLRHTAATLAIKGGASVKAVQAMLGHASAAMTLDIYADWFPDDMDEAANAVAAARSATPCAIFVPSWQEVTEASRSNAGETTPLSCDGKANAGLHQWFA